MPGGSHLIFLEIYDSRKGSYCLYIKLDPKWESSVSVTYIQKLQKQEKALQAINYRSNKRVGLLFSSMNKQEEVSFEPSLPRGEFRGDPIEIEVISFLPNVPPSNSKDLHEQIIFPFLFRVC